MNFIKLIIDVIVAMENNCLIVTGSVHLCGIVVQSRGYQCTFTYTMLHILKPMSSALPVILYVYVHCNGPYPQ